MNETNAAARAWLQQVWDAAHRFEQKLNMLKSGGQTLYQSSEFSRHALMSTSDIYAGSVQLTNEPLEGPDFDLPEGFEDFEPEVQAMIARSIGVQRAPPVATRAGVGLLGDPVSDSAMQAAILLSVAEEAIAQSTGHRVSRRSSGVC